VEGLLKKINIEHIKRWTSNIERRIMMSLRSSNYSKIEWKTNIQYRTFNSYFCFFILFHSTFDVGRSMFDVHFFDS